MAALVVALASPALAQSAKHAVQTANVTLVQYDSDGMPWTTVLGDLNPASPNAVGIHTSSQKDLIFGVSFECGLYTKTTVRSKAGITDTEFASAGVRVRVVVDPGTPNERIAEPGSDPNNDAIDDTGITYCQRKQTLSATLQGIIGNLACFPDGVFNPNAPGCVLTEEDITLILETLDANAFFYVLDQLGSGDHNVVVQARIDTAVSSNDAQAKALIGRGSVTVEEVRLVKGAAFSAFPR